MKMIQARSFKQALGQKLMRCFTRLGQHEKMIKSNPKVLDYSENPIVKMNIEEARNQFKRDSQIDGVKLLSEAAQRSRKEVKLGKELRIDKTKINREVRKFSKKAIDKSHEDSYEYLVQNDYFQLNSSKIEENKRLIQELTEFKKLFFEKKEIKRLLKMQERKPHNFLPISVIGEEERENQQQFQAYQETSNTIKNERIQNMLEGGAKENKKLSLLIQSGLMDTSKNIKQIVTASTELFMKEFNKDSIKGVKNTQQIYEDVIVKGDNEGQQDDDIVAAYNEEDMVTIDNMLVKFDEVQNSVQFVGERTKMMEIYADKIACLGFDITQEELSFVDFEALALFFEEFVSCTPDEKIKTLNKIQMIDSLRRYENYLYDKYRNNDIQLRVKGQMEYKDLTEKEQLNYIKYNIKKPSDLFLMMQNVPSEMLHATLISQFMQKIASFRFESKQNYLAVISNFNYRALLRHCVDSCPKMSDQDFVDMIWSLGKIHKDEHGVVYEKLFNRLMSVSTQEIKTRISRIPLKEISFMTRGYLKLHHLALNEQLNNEIMINLRSRLEARQGEDLNIFALQGLTLFMSFLNTPESKEIMLNFLLPLFHKEEIIKELDNVSLQEIFLGLASLAPQHSKEICSYFNAIVPQLIDISSKLETDTISDIMMVASACNYQNIKLFQEMKRRIIFNLREQKPCSESSIAKLLCSFAQYDVVRSLQRHVDYKESSNTNLTDNLLLFSYFPTLVFHQQSPQYIFYNRLSKEIDRVREKLSQKWLSVSIFGIASAQYKNFEFIDDCVQQIFNLIESEENVPARKNINELAMLLFGYSNLKRSNKWSRKMLELIRTLFMQNDFQKATPIAWAQFFNTLANTNTEAELDEVEQQFAEIVYADKIQPSVPLLTQNILLSLFFSFSRLKVDKDILYELFSFIQVNHLSNFQLYLLNISLQLSSLPSLCLQSASLRLKEVELYIQNVLTQKQNFYGNQRFTYEQISIQIKHILYDIIQSQIENSNQSEKEPIIQNYFDEETNLMIDFYIPRMKKALFVYTLDNCLIQEFTDSKTVSDLELSGLFQAKERILKNKNITIARVFTSEFNQIGLKSTIEQEKVLKKQYIENILFEKQSVQA